MFGRLNFRYKLILPYLFVILVSFGFVGFFLTRNLEEHSLQEIKTSLINQANLIRKQISPQDIRDQRIGCLDDLAKGLSPAIKSHITVINNQGKVLADSEVPRLKVQDVENHIDRPEIRDALNDKIGEQIRYSATLKIDMLYVAVPINDKKDIVGVLRLALPLTNVQKVLSAARNAVSIALIFALALAFVVGSVLAAETTKPINRIIKACHKFSKGDFNHRIIPDSKDEIGELALTLNKMAQDIEDKINEIKLHNQHLAAIFSSMAEGVIVVDKTSRIISVNPTIEKIFAVTKKGAEENLFLEVIRNNSIAEIITDVLRKGEFISQELNLVWPIHRVLKINTSPIFENDTISGCLLVIHDISEIRRLETMRSDFIANLSHELKTPLTSIKGFVETLLDGAVNDKANSRHFIEIIQQHVERLNSLVNDLLDLSYLESKEIRLERQDVNLKNLADEVLTGFKSHLKKKAIEAVNNLPANISAEADGYKLRQVFTNLIDNAIKFNKEKGTIAIYCEKLANRIKIIVEDSGAGIPSKDITRIFERFYRVDKARSRELGGTGLGLSIVKHIVELHGGVVGVESTEGLGSKFFFTLPK
jgi:two-component system phosphate regulon sensor histidine kinase PhoR